MAEDSQTADARIVRRSCETIAGLWYDATLIAYRLAQPDKTGGGAHSKYPRPRSPISDRDLDTLDSISQWLLDATSQLGMSRSVGYDAVKTDTEDVAIWIADRADKLAGEPDGNRWASDALHYARTLRRICHDVRPDSRQWRQRVVVWQPTVIADMLTRLTGRVVKAARIRLLAHRGKIEVIGNTVTLGEVVGALHSEK